MTTAYRLKNLLLALVVITGFAGFAAHSARAADHATILMYHRFGESDYPSTNVTIAQFEEHLEVLASGAYSVLPLEDIVASLQAGDPLPDRAVAITIDDAYLSVYEEAMPRLQEYGFHATLFVATRPVDRNLRAYMSWDQLRDWQAGGFGIGCQTQTHPHLHRLSPDANRDELRVSNERFIAELGIRHHCLPTLMANTIST